MSGYINASIIEIDMPSEDEIEDLLMRIDYFNCREQYIMPCKIGNDKNKLTFIYVKKPNPSRERENPSSLFGDSYTDKPFDISKLSRCEMNLISSAKKLMMKDSYCGDGTAKWTTKTKTEVLEDIENLIGFSDFKECIQKITRYIENAPSLSKSNYNIVLVKNCEVDEDMFIEMIYDLYLSSGIITDPFLVEGDLDDSRRTQRDTRFLFKIYEEWQNNDAPWMTQTIQYRIFKELGKRKTIFITSMDKVQYEKMEQNDAFMSVFPQAIYLNDITASEKVEYIKRELLSYGFLLDTTEFEKSPLVSNSLEKIKSIISVFARKRLENEKCDLLLDVNDFILKKKVGKKKSAFDELEALTGLESVKSTVKEIATFLKNKGIDALPCLHMVFRGNPGTGKTTVARIIGKIFAEIAIIKNADKFVEADRNKLVSQYLGGTARRTADAIKSAMGGVLFIDEAYSLNNGERYDYGNESVAVLVKQMEDYRKDFVCIMAGYTNEMDDMLNMNPGLRERVQFYIDFPDYDADELTEIFSMLCTDNKYKLNDNAKKIAKEYFEKIIKNKDRYFANGRIARKVFERIKMKQALRTKGNMIVEVDVKNAFFDNDLEKLINPIQKNKSIGF